MNKKIPKNDQGKNLRIFRKMLNLNQEEFAAVVGSTQPTVQKYESGVLAVPVEIIRLLNKKYKMSYEWFLDSVGSKVIKDEKKNIIKDFASLQNKYELLELKFNNLESILKKLYADFYEREYNGHKLNKMPVNHDNQLK